jgi:ketosteroid isomerase-like protein
LEEVFNEYFDPEIEWSDPPGFPGAGFHKGRAAVEARFYDMEEMLAGFSMQPEALYGAGPKVVCFGRTGGRGRSSGIEVSRQVAWVLTVEEGRVVKAVGFEERDAALRDAGLDPDQT